MFRALDSLTYTGNRPGCLQKSSLMYKTKNFSRNLKLFSIKYSRVIQFVYAYSTCFIRNSSYNLLLCCFVTTLVSNNNAALSSFYVQFIPTNNSRVSTAFPNILNLCMYSTKRSFSLITVNRSSLLVHQDPLFLSTRLLSITNLDCMHAAF